MVEYRKVTELKLHGNNPRFIKDDKFKKLVQSIKDFPEMLEKRPLVVDEDGIILGGNMRFRSCLELKMKEVPVIVAKGWTDEQKNEFVIKDNVSSGEFDFDVLANNWDVLELEEWGLDVWQAQEEVDYSILDDEDVEEQLNDMTNGVKKAIQIEFEAEHYDEASELVKFWREQGGYVGGMIMEFLKAEKEKI
jgi:ParB-like chromosome segregation protein Spo0J